MQANEPSNQPLHKNQLFLGCVIAPLLLFLILMALSIVFYSRKKESKPEFISSAKPIVEQQIKDIEKREELLKQKKITYDIDQTITALFSIEKAMSEAKNFQELTTFITQKNSELVSPDVAKLKIKIFKVYEDILQSEDRLDEIDSIYRITVGSITDFIGLLGADPRVGGISFDRKNAQKIWRKKVAEMSARDRIKERLIKHQDKLLDVLFELEKLNSKYMKEWNNLCSVRDRAYLAFYEKNWDEMINCSVKAIEMSPDETEAHILLALALMEKGTETDLSAAKNIINKLLTKSQGQEAPAFLLRGVLEMKKAKFQEAILDFDQSATYYPKQQEDLTDKLNLYRKRPFLNKSKEGRAIINTYRGIMSGSGYFSPDFQKARVYLAQGENQKAKDKIFDHFFRRRLQGQWDKVFTDFMFSKIFLGTELDEILADEKVNLSIEPAWISNSLIVTVNNNSEKDIHNVTILLCVRFTDMFKGDYITFPFGNSAAVVGSGQSVNFGKQNISEVTRENLGTVKKWKDIIEYGAVLISDEIITWVPPIKNENADIQKDDEQNTVSSNQFDETTEKAKKIFQKYVVDFIDSLAKEQDKNKEKLDKSKVK